MKQSKDWECMECGKRMTLKQAERATSGTEGCPGCGGVDIDMAARTETNHGSHEFYGDTLPCGRCGYAPIPA